MNATKSAAEQLAEAIEIADAATAKVEALKQQSRAEDLAIAKSVIKMHGFTATDLRPELKTSRTPAKAATPRKSPPRRKSK